MTKEEFINILDKIESTRSDKKGYSSYKIEGDKIVVTHNRYVDLGSLKTLPPGVEFNNVGSVYLHLLETLPPGVQFNNKGSVDLRSI